MGKSINLRFGGECRMENKMNLQDTFFKRGTERKCFGKHFLNQRSPAPGTCEVF